MKLARIIFGVVLGVAGIGLVLLGAYIMMSMVSLASLGGFIVLLGFGSAVAYVGYQLARGGSVKDALYFLSFFH